MSSTAAAPASVSVTKYSAWRTAPSRWKLGVSGAMSRKANRTCTPVWTTRTSCRSSTRLRSQRSSSVSLRPTGSISGVIVATKDLYPACGPLHHPCDAGRVLVHLLALALAAATPAPAEKLFEFQDPSIVESSGIVASSRRDD